MDYLVLLNHIISFILVLYQDPNLPRKIVDVVINYMNDFYCQQLLPSLKNEIINILQNEKVSNEALVKLDTVFREQSLIFDKVNTEAKRFTLLS